MRRRPSTRTARLFFVLTLASMSLMGAHAWSSTALETMSPQQKPDAAPADDRKGWTIPAGAEAEKNPLPPNDAVRLAGRKFFASKCQRCHGSLGKGDGEDADKKYTREMDLTRADRLDRNPDGVVFYKIWNGRSSPKMPRFGEDLSREQVWALVMYAQGLRSK